MCRALIFGLLHVLVDLCQVCSYDAPPGQNWTFPWGVTSWNIGTKKEISKFFFSETGRPRALIFGMLHVLVDLYQVCSYDTPPGQNWTFPWGVTSWNIGTKKEISKFFFSETGRPRALIFGMLHVLVDLYQVCSYDTPPGQNWAFLGGGGGGAHKLEHRNKERKFQSSSSLKLEGLEL